MYQGYNSNKDGVLSQEAIKIIDKGLSGKISKVFKSNVVDLEKEVFVEVFAKDVLDAAVSGKLKHLLSKQPIRRRSSNVHIEKVT